MSDYSGDQITEAEVKSLYSHARAKSERPRTSFKKAGPLAITLAVLGATVAAIFGSVSMLGAHFEALFTEATDTSFGAYVGDYRSVTRSFLTGERAMPSYMKKRFAAQDIEVGDGAFVYEGQTITSENFDSVIESSPKFREALGKAKRGRIANYFDEAAERLFARLGLTRNLFHNYKQSGDEATDSANRTNTLLERFSGGTDANINTAKDELVVDENGEPVLDEAGNYQYERVPTGEDVTSRGGTGDGATSKAQSYILEASGKVSATAGIACGAWKVGNMVAVAGASYATYSTIHFFMNNAESVSKMKWGSKGESPINSFLNWFTRKDNATYFNSDTNSEVAAEYLAPIQGEGSKLMLGDTSVDQNITKHFSTNALFASVGTAMLMNGLMPKVCPAFEIGAAGIHIATIAAAGTGFLHLTMGFLIDVLVTHAQQIAIAAILSSLVPILARTLFTNPIEYFNGQPGGEYLARGAAEANSKNSRTNSGQTAASAERILQYNEQYATILQQAAEEDRLHRSPLDPTSKNTFLGSLIAKLLPFATTTTLGSNLFTLGNIATTSLNSLNPAYAAGEGSSFSTTFGDCPAIEELYGARGNIYCGQIAISDPTTIGLSPSDPTYRSVIDPNLIIDENGRETVREGSELAKFIVLGLDNDGLLGYPNAGILAACETNFGIAQSIPYLSDIVAIVNAAEAAACEDIATGKAYINSAENPRWDPEIKYYQHWVAENRVLDQMQYFNNPELGTGPNPVTAYREKYYAEHPLDNSRAGILARISGLEKSDAETVLAIMDYSNFLAAYHPAERKDFTAKDEKPFASSSEERVRSTASTETRSPVTTGATKRSEEERRKRFLSEAAA